MKYPTYRIGVAVILRDKLRNKYILQVRDEGIAEAGKVGLAGGFINPYNGDTWITGLIRELEKESDGIITADMVYDGLDYKPVYNRTVNDWAFNDKRTENTVEMTKSHYFHIVDISDDTAKKLVQAGNENDEVRNWFEVDANEDAIMSLDWAEWRNINKPDEAGDFHQREATINALKRS